MLSDGYLYGGGELTLYLYGSVGGGDYYGVVDEVGGVVVYDYGVYDYGNVVDSIEVVLVDYYDDFNVLFYVYRPEFLYVYSYLTCRCFVAGCCIYFGDGV